ncbi:MAG: ABC transporter permease [Bacteroidales bacterium]|jgi:putative ABC transport system permease protein|nr:ABC transporter permease [Bacteroidales bacterium]MCI2122174.1 ABC transporter permease [Bacteroidales bacterium]MCI2145163.1 ABC transporter permease [Bacteroidales bacterium]
MGYFKSTFNFFGRNKLYTLVNVLGLSVALMFVILLSNFAYDSLTVDGSQKNGNRIYALANEEMIGTAYRIQDHLISRYPEIEKTTGFGSDRIEIRNNGKLSWAKVSFVDSTFLDIFSFKLLEGDRASVLASKTNVLISKSYAAKLYGNENPVGKTINFIGCGRDEEAYTIAGVLDDIRKSVIPETDIMANFSVAGYYNSSLVWASMNNAGSASVFILAKKGSDLQAKIPDMEKYFKEFFWPYQRNMWKEVRLIPLKDVYFSSLEDVSSMNRGERGTMDLMAVLALFILLFAILNYVNLSVAQSGFRAKEMATRMLVGSSKRAVFRRMILEAILMTAIAFVIGFFLALAAQPEANRLLHGNINMIRDFDLIHAASYILLIVAVGVVAGAIPAGVISSCKPVEVVRGTFRRKVNTTYGKILITLQNVISIVMVACAITIGMQTRHMVKAPLGYDTKDILDLSMSYAGSYSNMSAFKKSVESLSCVKMTAFGCGVPTTGGNNNTISCGEKQMSFQMLDGDDAYFEMLGITKADGSKITKSNSYYFNPEAFKESGTPEDSPEIRLGENGDVIWKSAGMCKDFKVWNGTRSQPPVAMRDFGDFDELNRDTLKRTPWELLIRTIGNHKEAYRRINEEYAKVTGFDLGGGNYLEDELKKQFGKEETDSKLVGLFTLVALILSSLGLFAISTYYIRQSLPDIAIRKVLGSTSGNELRRVIVSYVKLVAIAFVIGCPVAWYLMSQWLRNYSYRISLNPLIFIVSGLLCSLLALASVFWQSFGAANENPVTAIKKE